MKKNSSMQGTLNRLFGKKNANNNSLYATNPPWMLAPAAGRADFTDDLHNSFAFLDDSGTATLKSRPGPRVRPMLNFSTSNTDAQGLAVPTPSVPLGFTDNASIGNGPKLNGNYRMCSSVGDLRLNNYYDDDFEEIPAPPSMPPPPPPTMAPSLPQNSLPSSAVSSPSSPSPPDFIPPTPNSSAPMPPSFLPTAEQHQINNAAKWKSELVLNAASKDLPMTLPNRLSLNPAAFQHTQGQANFDVDPRSTLPKSFKVPPPAPARTSSIQSQEPQHISYSKDPPQSPVPSSFNPSCQAKLFTSSPGKQALNDTLSKRKSVLIMEDHPDFLENSDQRIEKSANVTDSVSSRAALSLQDSTNVLQNPHVELNKQIKNEDAINDEKKESTPIFKENHPKQPYKLNNTVSLAPAKSEGQKYFQNGTERNAPTSKYGYTPEMHKTSKPTVKVISLKPVRGELSLANSNGSKNYSLTRKETDLISQDLTILDNEVKSKQDRSLENVEECPPAPPFEAPPPPPPLITVSQNRQLITPLPLPVQNIMPPKTSPIINTTAPPPAPACDPATVVRMPSPLLSPKPKTISVTLKPQSPILNTTAPPLAPPCDPATVVRMPSPLLSPEPKTISVTPKPQSLVPLPPKAPPAPPPLPSSVGPSSSVPLLEALQEKQQSLRKIPKSIEVRPAQTNSISGMDDEQKVRVGKIKGELEALFSPKTDESRERLKKLRSDKEENKNSNGNVSLLKGGENKLVNSLMLKVPLLPAKIEKDDVDGDNSEWVTKSNRMDIPIPEPDYLPVSTIHKTEKSTYSEVRNKIPKANLEISAPSPPLASPQKDTDTADDVMKSSIPIYKPHRETKASTESTFLVELPVVISKPEADVSINLHSSPQNAETATARHSVKEDTLTSQAESTIKQHGSGEEVVANSPMALLMAAQKRAQKAKSIEKTNLPKISVTNGVITSLSASPYNERTATTFVVPNKENVGQLPEEEVTSFTSNAFHVSDSSSVPSAWTDAQLQSSHVSSAFYRNSQNSLHQSSAPYVPNVVDAHVSTTNRNEEYLAPKATTFYDHISTTVPNSTEPLAFNISSFPSPTLESKLGYEIEYGIIPPPAEFMNSPVPLSSNLISMQQRERSHFDHTTRLQSDLIPYYTRNNSGSQPFVSLSTTSNSGFTNYSSDNYNTAPRDLQRGSLIKKRLYMPEPESSRGYGSNISSLRSSTMPMSYSNMHAQSSSNMIPDPRRSNTMSRFVPQGRRVSSENTGRIVPSMTDMMYKGQNADLSLGKSSSRSQSKCQQGMTFTVRPGTRQPISQMYQGGYL